MKFNKDVGPGEKEPKLMYVGHMFILDYRVYENVKLTFYTSEFL